MSNKLTPGAYCRGTFRLIDYQYLCRRAAIRVGFNVEEIDVSLAVPILCLRREADNPRACVYLSGGMHGDEPAGSLALIRMLYKDLLPRDISYMIFPLLNPEGMALVSRDNVHGADINRDYKRFITTEARAHHEHIQKSGIDRFDICICLHEDWEANGFYLYEVTENWEPGGGDRIIQSVSEVATIERGDEIDGHPASNGVIRPKERPTLQDDDWPEALYLLDHYTKHSYTLETPSNTDLLCRIKAQTKAVLTALECL